MRSRALALVVLFISPFLGTGAEAQDGVKPKTEVPVPSATAGAEGVSVPSLSTRIIEANDLRAKGKSPFHLQLSFQLFDMSGKAQEQGSLDDWWAGDAGTSVQIESPSLGKLEKPDESSLTADGPRRSAYLVHQLLDAVLNPAGPLRARGNLISADVAYGKFELTCLYVEPLQATKRPPQAYTQVCTGRTDSTVRLVQETNKAVSRNRLGKFANTSVALDVEIDYIGRPAIKGHIEKLQGFDPAHSPVSLKQSASVAPTPGSRGVAAGGEPAVQSGKKISGQAPLYPPVARMQRISGTVLLGATITRQGTIGTIFPIASADPSLIGAATDAVKTWTYTPYLLNGKPTEVDTTVTVNFNLSSGSSSVF